MKDYSLEQRAGFYANAFPKYPPVVVANGWLYGVWMIGNNYKGSGYYGSYPPGYLRRVCSMFPDAENILHLFSGSLTAADVGEADRFDISQPAEYNGDAHALSSIVGEQSYDLILADPPYSAEDAEHYGRPMINRNRVVHECIRVLRAGGFLVWLDQVLPMYKKEYLNLVGTIGVVRSTNHRFRVVSIFYRTEA